MLGHGGIGTQDKTVFLKGSTLGAAGWQHFLQYCDPYCFAGVLPQPLATSYFQYTGVYRMIIDAVSNTDQSDEAAEVACRAMETAIAESLTAFERCWPKVLMSGPVLHTMIHYPRFIYRWNSVRNYWCYFNERYVYAASVLLFRALMHSIMCCLQNIMCCSQNIMCCSQNIMCC